MPATNTGMYVSKPYKQKMQKISDTNKITIESAKEELDYLTKNVQKLSTGEDYWDKKRRLLAIIDNKENT